MRPEGSGGPVSVEIALYANLRRYRPADGGTGPFWLEVPAGTTVAGLMRILGIPASMIKQAFVDHIQQDGDYVLPDRSRVAIFSPIAGGQVGASHPRRASPHASATPALCNWIRGGEPDAGSGATPAAMRRRVT